MQKIIEVQGFSFSFTLNGIVIRDKSFEFETFNYGGGSFYQKFKSKVPVDLHDDLRAIKDVDMYIADNSGNVFSFVTFLKNEEDVLVLVNRVLRVCKAVHAYTHPVEVSIKKKILVEDISNVFVA